MKETELFLKIKKQIIQNRRKESFSFTNFNRNVENNLNEILKTFDTRWLISIVDTYTQSDKFKDKAESILISTFVNMLKLWGTDTYFNKGLTPTDYKMLVYNQYELWDGMITYSPHHGDTYKNLISKIQTVLYNNNMLLFKIFSEILNRAKNDKGCPLSRLTRPLLYIDVKPPQKHK